VAWLAERRHRGQSPGDVPPAFAAWEGQAPTESGSRGSWIPGAGRPKPWTGLCTDCAEPRALGLLVAIREAIPAWPARVTKRRAPSGPRQSLPVCKERAGDWDGLGRWKPCGAASQGSPGARRGNPWDPLIARAGLLSRAAQGSSRGVRCIPGSGSGVTWGHPTPLWSPSRPGRDPQPHRHGRAGRTERATRRLAERRRRAGAGRGGAVLRGLLLPPSSSSSPSSARAQPPRRRLLLLPPCAPGAMFNRAVSRLSRKRPPSGKLLAGSAHGDRGTGRDREEPPRPACPLGIPSLPSGLGRGSEVPPRREPRPPRHFSALGCAPRGPRRRGSAESRETLRGGSLAERGTRAVFFLVMVWEKRRSKTPPNSGGRVGSRFRKQYAGGFPPLWSEFSASAAGDWGRMPPRARGGPAGPRASLWAVGPAVPGPAALHPGAQKWGHEGSRTPGWRYVWFASAKRQHGKGFSLTVTLDQPEPQFGATW
jgi:hypothetical protein